MTHSFPTARSPDVEGVAIRTHAAQIEEQLALRLGGGYFDQTPVTHDVFVDFGLDPVNGDGNQPHATLGVETLDGFHEADISLLDKVGMGQAIAQVLARRSEERRVGKECASTCRSRCSPDHEKKQNDNKNTHTKPNAPNH